jgi:hypothetical protein
VAQVVAENGDPVVMVQVGEDAITVDQFMQYLSRNPKRLEQATTSAGKANVVRDLIGNLLMQQAMRREGLIAESTEREAELQEAYAQLAEKHFPLPPAPEEAALRRFYEQHRDDFGIPASVRLSQVHITVPADAGDAERAAARARADAALARIEAGESFAEVAADVNDNQRAKMNEGDVGFIWRYGTEWLEDALDGLSVGEHTGVVRSPWGFDILLITDARDAVETPFEDAREAISERMRRAAQSQAQAQYLKRLAADAKISVQLDYLKEAFSAGIFP